MPTRHFLAYLTANERPYYVADFLNFRHMARKPPGVDRITVYVAVSRVRPFSPIDDAAIAGLSELCRSCDWLELRAVYWKGNVGRDFSSAEACLRAIGQEAGPDDYIMVRNRSGYGPFQANWFKVYMHQYLRFPDTGLVGSTISMQRHPKRVPPLPGPPTHVQTYTYLSQWRHFEPLVSAFPGARCVERFDLLHEGEVGLSRSMLDRGLSLSCLHWPNECFTPAQPMVEHLPTIDMKKSAIDVPLRYRFPSYFWQPRELLAQTAWVARQARRRIQPRAPAPAAGIERVTLNAYD